ncbi:DUF805 domain-containing protein [Corynebacterium glyciniphilum]|uniref:DUF805 domain-containing protein n=1 Tax=Corynebacterium glyciniphilum TaxID=1404244 RepID=UPI0016430E19|nr:DUF805 domain-containing protein [Corynebacterium glyciniphilum]
MGHATTVEPSLSRADCSASFTRAVKRFFTRWARFKGRSSRREFWFPVLAFAVMYIVFGIMQDITGVPTTRVSLILTGIFYAVLFLPALSLVWRRLHDAGYAGPWAFVAFVPLVGAITLLVLAAQPSSPERMRPVWEDPDVLDPQQRSNAPSFAFFVMLLQIALLLATTVCFVAGLNNVYLAEQSAGASLHNVQGAWGYMSCAATFGGVFAVVYLSSLIYSCRADYPVTDD